MNNYHFIYIAVLVVVAAGLFAATTVDFEDKGSCAMSTNGDIKVRQPGTETFVSKAYCIIINT